MVVIVDKLLMHNSETAIEEIQIKMEPKQTKILIRPTYISTHRHYHDCHPQSQHELDEKAPQEIPR